MTSDRREVTQALKRARQTERDLRALSAPTTIGDRRSMRRRDRPAAEGGIGRKALREATACTTAVTAQITARGTARGGQRRAAVALVGFSTTPVLCARFVVGPLRWQLCVFVWLFLLLLVSRHRHSGAPATPRTPAGGRACGMPKPMGGLVFRPRLVRRCARVRAVSAAYVRMSSSNII